VPRVRLKEGLEGRRRAQEDGHTGAEVRVPPGEEVLRQNRTGTPAGSTPPPPGSSRPSPSAGVPRDGGEMVHGAGTQEDPRGRRRWIGDETFVRVAGKTMYPGSGWWTGGAGLSRGFSPPEGGRPRPGDGSLPGASKRMRQALMSARRKPGIPPSPQEPRPRLEGGRRRAQEGVGRPEDGSTTNPLEGHWSHFGCWCGVHRGFKRWANAQHYHEQYVRARNHPEKTLIQLLIPDK